MSWFDERLIDTDIKSYGVYLALLYVRFYTFTAGFFNEDRTKSSILDEISRRLSGEEALEATDAARLFIERVYAHEHNGKRFSDTLTKTLDYIESKYYEFFKSACYRCFKRAVIVDIDDIKSFLLISKKNASERTPAGSVQLAYPISSLSSLYAFLKGESKPENLMSDVERERFNKLLSSLVHSNLILFNQIIPAPYLEDDFINRLEAPTLAFAKEQFKIEMQALLTREQSNLSWRALEEICAEALAELGFKGIFRPKPDVGVKLDSRSGGKIEVDVWGWKQVGQVKLSIYVSCKNWDKEVDRAVVDEEFGRTLQLIEIPHIKVLIAKRFTEPARRAAQLNGFIIMELGNEAINREKAYKTIFSGLKEIFMNIAPLET